MPATEPVQSRKNWRRLSWPWRLGAVLVPVLAALLLMRGYAPRMREAVPLAVVEEGEEGTWNDAARFLAGLKGRENGAYRRLEESPAWRKYHSEWNETWSRAEKEQFEAVDAFQKRELASFHGNSDFVFYPLSGPDVLYVTRFFPDSRVFVLAGLERVGSLRRLGEFTPENLERELRGWKQAVESIFERSFFVTSEMDRYYHGRVSDGLLPAMLLLLARDGCVIEQVRYVRVDSSGELLPEKPGEQVRRHEGVEIRFRRGGEAGSRKLFYFSTNLGPEFERTPRFSSFLRRLGRPDTLVKSAAFLLHWKTGTGLRNYILENSNLILEDDTGVPFRYFRPSDWQVQLFGEYSPPDHLFRRQYQEDLAEAFQDPARVRPLGFSLGYGAGRRPSSMILARRARPLARPGTSSQPSR